MRQNIRKLKFNVRFLKIIQIRLILKFMVSIKIDLQL